MLKHICSKIIIDKRSSIFVYIFAQQYNVSYYDVKFCALQLSPCQSEYWIEWDTGTEMYNFQEFIHSLHVLDLVNDNHQIICPLVLLKDKTSSLISLVTVERRWKMRRRDEKQTNENEKWDFKDWRYQDYQSELTYKLS